MWGWVTRITTNPTAIPFTIRMTCGTSATWGRRIVISICIVTLWWVPTATHLSIQWIIGRSLLPWVGWLLCSEPVCDLCLPLPLHLDPCPFAEALLLFWSTTISASMSGVVRQLRGTLVVMVPWATWPGIRGIKLHIVGQMFSSHNLIDFICTFPNYGHWIRQGCNSLLSHVMFMLGRWSILLIIFIFYI